MSLSFNRPLSQACEQKEALPTLCVRTYGYVMAGTYLYRTCIEGYERSLIQPKSIQQAMCQSFSRNLVRGQFDTANQWLGCSCQAPPRRSWCLAWRTKVNYIWNYNRGTHCDATTITRNTVIEATLRRTIEWIVLFPYACQLIQSNPSIHKKLYVYDVSDKEIQRKRRVVILTKLVVVAMPLQALHNKPVQDGPAGIGMMKRDNINTDTRSVYSCMHLFIHIYNHKFTQLSIRTT